eukprot:1141533-Pelagomonas_calceolata.AAC.7
MALTWSGSIEGTDGRRAASLCGAPDFAASCQCCKIVTLQPCQIGHLPLQGTPLHHHLPMALFWRRSRERHGCAAFAHAPEEPPTFLPLAIAASGGPY